MEELSINLGDELERKTIEALSCIVGDYEQGAISQPQASFALRILFMTTSGLAGSEAFELVSNASAQIEAEVKRDMVRRFFVNPAKQELTLLQYAYGEAEVTIKRGAYPMKPGQVNVWTRTSRATFENEVDPFQAARDRFHGYAQALCRQGFQEIL